MSKTPTKEQNMNIRFIQKIDRRKNYQDVRVYVEGEKLAAYRVSVYKNRDAVTVLDLIAVRAYREAAGATRIAEHCFSVHYANMDEFLADVAAA